MSKVEKPDRNKSPATVAEPPIPADVDADTQKRRFHFNTLDFVVSVLDANAGNFRAHAHAVARYSRVMAEHLKLSLDETDEVVTAAYLHDFNKLIEMKKKTYDMQEMLNTLNAPASLSAIVRHMHEKFDGSGTPDGLKGEAIPLGSRILAVANMLDEISRGKVDTQVMRREEAFDSLRKRAGTYLDPQLVDCLIDGLKSRFRQYYKESDARVLIAAEADDQRFFVANVLMESGFTVHTSKDADDAFEQVQQFSPHLVVLSSGLFGKLSELCSSNDVYVQQPVLVVGRRGGATEIPSSDFVPIEDFVETPIDALMLGDKVDKIFERVVRQEAKQRDAAAFFERSGNNVKAGDIYKELGDHRKAADMYEVAGAYGMAGEMYELVKDVKRAAKAFEMAGDYVKAATYYNEAGMFEDRGRVYEKTGDAYYTAKNRLFQGDSSGALEYFKKVEPSHAKFRKACYYLAKLLMDKKDWSGSIRAYERLIDGESIAPGNVRHFYNVALSQEHLQHYHEALEIYEKILGVDYNFRDVYKRIERLRRKLQQQEQQTKMEHKVTDFADVGTKRSAAANTRYEKIRVLGRGGMGVVYEATDLVLGRKVALKVLSAAFREDKLVVETFLREAKAAAMLNHVNIVTIFDAGIENNNYFIAMEAIAGSTLKEIIAEKRFSIPSVLRIMRQICNGLKYAHSKKIIHRDLTNSNIMLTKDNIVKIMDFGLARIVEHLMSEQSIIGGTPSYMAPEQVQGAPIDQRADIYALGINLFELTTGRLPFLKGDLGYHHIHTAPPNPRELNAKIPQELNAVILKCLEKNPDDRYQSVAELMQALKI